MCKGYNSLHKYFFEHVKVNHKKTLLIRILGATPKQSNHCGHLLKGEYQGSFLPERELNISYHLK